MRPRSKTLSSRWLIFLTLVFAIYAAGALLPTHGVSGQAVRPPAQDINRVLRQHDLLKLTPRDLLKSARQTGHITLATSRGTFDLDIEPFDIRSENYRSIAVGADRISRELPRTPSRSFRGKVAGKSDTYVRLVLDEKVFEGIIITPDETFFVEPSRDFNPTGSDNDFVFYAQSSVIQQNLGECGTTLAQSVGHQTVTKQSVTLSAQAPSPESVLGPEAEAEVATEADFEFTSAHASETATNQDITDVMTAVDGIYDAQLGIKLKIVFQRAWTANNDPYTLTAAAAALGEFKDSYDNSFAPGTPPTRDLTHMFTGKDLDSSTIGIAYIGTICDAPDAAYGISQSGFSGMLSDRAALSAHEIGHNFGASHPNEETPVPPNCSQSIMNSFIVSSSQPQFCQFSRDQITNHVVGTGGACLTRLTQPGCSYSLSGTFFNFGAAGGTGAVDVTATGGCAWAVAEGAGWLDETPANGSGTGTVNFTAAANTGGPRRVIADIGGQKFTVLQSASPACGLTPITPGAIVTGNLATTDCFSGQPDRETSYVDLYSFNGMAGQQVRIEMSADPAVQSTLDTYLYLFAPDGSLIAENDDIDLGVVTNSRIPVAAGTFFTLPQTGSYTIVATSFDNNATGQYTLALTTVPLLLAEQGNGSVVAALDSVTFVRNQDDAHTAFRIFDPYNFSSDQITRLILFTSDLGLPSQLNPDPAVLSVSASGQQLIVENVGPFSFPGSNGSYVIAKLKRRDGNALTTGTLSLTVTCRSQTSNAATVAIVP
jgi:reprolysin-like metallo-peptidase family M12B/pre-peptidase